MVKLSFKNQHWKCLSFMKKKLLKRVLALITYQKNEKPPSFVLKNASPLPKKVNLEKPLKINPSIKSQKNGNVLSSYEENLAFLREQFHASSNKDIVIREFLLTGNIRGFLVFLDGMVDRITINQFILGPILTADVSSIPKSDVLAYLSQQVLQTNSIEKVSNQQDILFKILTGDTGLYIEQSSYFIFSETKGYDKRGVEKPLTESVVKGSQEAFTENLKTNLTLIRRILKNSQLTTEYFLIGDRSHTQCAILYVNQLANPGLVQEVKRRLQNIKIDFLTGDGMLEQMIDEHPYAFIPTILSTERPDRVATYLSEGRVAIIAEGTPFSLVVPITLVSLFHTSEDANLKFQFATSVRILRLLAFFSATLLPALYIAMTNFHREMIPTELLISIAKAREEVPFPTIIEVIFMEMGFELIREAGIRIPGIIGNTIGIIGGLILGQAAVEANLVSPILVIIIAITGLGNFSMPNFSLGFAARIFRIGFIIAGGFIGFYGIILLFLLLLGYFTHIKSFGVSMFSPLVPFDSKNHDAFIRKPLWKRSYRPSYVKPLDATSEPKISRKWSNTPPKPTI